MPEKTETPDQTSRGFRFVLTSGREGAAALRDRDQAGRRLEALAVGGGELAGPGDEAGRATARLALEAVDVLDRATEDGREADAEDRADVGLGGGVQDTLVEA